MDGDGWSQGSVVKETDTHLGSKDGNCVFNYRLVFPLTLPCSFPRLKIAAFDYAAFSPDESIGSTTIDFSEWITTLVKHGRIDKSATKISLRDNSAINSKVGEVLISVKILQKSEADGSPVGEGQDEPNRDPYLEKPKVGRGMGDFIEGTAFNFNFNFGWLRWMKYAGLASSILAVLYILFVNPGILVSRAS